MLQTLLENNVQSVQTDTAMILKECSSKPKVRHNLLEIIKGHLWDFVDSSNVKQIVSLFSTWKTHDDISQFVELLGGVFLQQETQDLAAKHFLQDFWVPAMSLVADSEESECLELLDKMADIFPLNSVSEDDYKLFLTKLPVLLSNLFRLQCKNEDLGTKAVKSLIKYLGEKRYSSEIVDIFFNSSISLPKHERELKSNLIKLISEKDLNAIAKEFYDCHHFEQHELTNVIKSLFEEEELACKTFFFDTLIPFIMNDPSQTSSVDTIVNNIDIALEFANVMSVINLNSKEYDCFLSQVLEYITKIVELQRNNFAHWHRMWIVLVRVLGKKLHHSPTLINKLLRVVEHAFRNCNTAQRIRGYDCWKELIDNVSMDIAFMSSDKQIKLLLTPLKAKFSKQVSLIEKRFEVFVYLIKKLQDRAYLVLKEFLEFCFGEVGENTDPTKAGQGKSIPELWLRSAKVLLSLLGHSHDNSEKCLKSDDEISMEFPLLNTNNISRCHTHVINSVAECCILLKDVELGQPKHLVFKCFWTSLLRLVLNGETSVLSACVQTLDTVLKKLLQDDDPYYNSIAATILRCIMKFDKEKIFDLVVNNLNYILRYILSVPLDANWHIDIEKLQALISFVESTESKKSVNSAILESFSKYKTEECNVNFVASFWIQVANNLNDYSKENVMDFLLWPALHMHHMTENAKAALVQDIYKEIVTKNVEKSDEMYLALLKNFERLFKNNPLLIKNILPLVTNFTPKNDNKAIINTTLDLLSMWLVVPITDERETVRHSIELYLIKICQSFIPKIHEKETIVKFCTCLEHLLKAKHFDILVQVVENLKSLPDHVKWIYSKCLSLDFLMEVFEKETDLKATEKIHKLVELLRNLKNPEPIVEAKSQRPISGRSAKIASLVKKQFPSNPPSPSTLRLFGTDIDTGSPLKLKGSLLNAQESRPNTPKIVHILPESKPVTPLIDEESNSKFVLIDSEVKLDKTKLTQHQKETLNKRREDIPALYQDLSQSLDQNSVDSNSKQDFKKPADVNETLLQIDKEDSVESEEERKLKKELQRLSLNIVGADDFRKISPRRKRDKSKSRHEDSEKLNKGENETRKRRKQVNPTHLDLDKKAAAKKNAGRSLPTTKKITKSKKALEFSQQQNPKTNNNATLTQSELFTSGELISKKQFRGHVTADSEACQEGVTEEKTLKEVVILIDEKIESLKPATIKTRISKQLEPLKKENYELVKSQTASTKSEKLNSSKKDIRKGKRKRVRSSDDEDVIESSQESSVSNISVTKLKFLNNKLGDGKVLLTQSAKKKREISEENDSSQKKRKRGRPKHNQSKDKLMEVSQDKTLEDEILETPLIKSTASQDTQTQNTESPVATSQIELQLDRPEKPVLTEVDRQIALMDTVSLLGSEVVKCSEADTDEACKTVIENKTIVAEEVEQKEHEDNPMEEEEKEVEKIKCENLTKTIVAEEEVQKENEDNAMEEENEVEKTKCENLTNMIVTEEEEQKLNADNAMEEEKKEVEETKCENLDSTDVDWDETKIDDAGGEETTQIACGDLAVLPESDVAVHAPASPNVQEFASLEHESPDRNHQNILLGDLPASPINGDTPNRTSDLLNATSNISPIGLKSSSDEEDFIEGQQRKLVPVALKFDYEETTNPAEPHKEKSPEKADDAPEKVDDSSPEKAEKEVGGSAESPPKNETNTNEEGNTIAERSSKLFEIINVGSPANRRFFKRKSGLHASPSASRIRKLMSNVKLPSQNEFTDGMSQDDILTFTREVPSPLAVPRSSILKRKHSDTLDDMSPCAKRKRVNFSDPCTTSKKVFLKDDQTSPSKCFLKPDLEDDIDEQFLEVLAANCIPTTPPSESDNIETEQSLQVDNPLLLQGEKPIYAELVDCQESVSVISRKMTSPMFVHAFLSKLHNSNIHTIGDLARQSEVDISRLPFKTPMVPNVFKALDNYYHKNFKSKRSAGGEGKEREQSPEEEATSEIALLKDNLHDDLKDVSERATTESERSADGGEEKEREQSPEEETTSEDALLKNNLHDDLKDILERAMTEDFTLETCSLLVTSIAEKASEEVAAQTMGIFAQKLGSVLSSKEQVVQLLLNILQNLAKSPKNE